MKTGQDIRTVYVHSRNQWRRWLEQHASGTEAVKLVLARGYRNLLPSLRYDEVMEEAICFGWIDYKSGRKDAVSYYLYLAPRKTGHDWTPINMQRAENMIRAGLMTPAGQVHVDQARKEGKWSAGSGPQGLAIPEDLQRNFEKNTIAFENFNAFAPSSKRIILEWIGSAAAPEIRRQRIDRVIELAGWR